LIKIVPSILSADFANLQRDIKRAEDAGADMLHIDVMDGHFVPNITVGVPVVESVKRVTRLPLDVHLMIEEPEKYIEPFAHAGSDIIVFHIEATDRPEELIARIRQLGAKPAVSVNPETGLDGILDILDKLDMVLVMFVHPGFAGQALMPDVVWKVKELRKRAPRGFDIEVDGGINEETISKIARAGANVFVAGTAVFGKPDVAHAIKTLRQRAEKAFEAHLEKE
jgi:ribulose-phosphate 3-epimerase